MYLLTFSITFKAQEICARRTEVLVKGKSQSSSNCPVPSTPRLSAVVRCDCSHDSLTQHLQISTLRT